jgi:hypothetical protein
MILQRECGYGKIAGGLFNRNEPTFARGIVFSSMIEGLVRELTPGSREPGED